MSTQIIESGGAKLSPHEIVETAGSGPGSSPGTDLSLASRRNQPLKVATAAETNWITAILSDFAVQAKGDLRRALDLTTRPDVTEKFVKSIMARSGSMSPSKLGATVVDSLSETYKKFGYEAMSNIASAGSRLAAGLSAGVGEAVQEATEEAIEKGTREVFGRTASTVLSTTIGAMTGAVIGAGIAFVASVLAKGIWQAIKCFFSGCTKPVFNHPSSWWTWNDTGSSAWMFRGPGCSVAAFTQRSGVSRTSVNTSVFPERKETYFESCVGNYGVRAWVKLLEQRCAYYRFSFAESLCDRSNGFVFYAPGGYLANSADGLRRFPDSRAFARMLMDLLGLTGWYQDTQLEEIINGWEYQLTNIGCARLGKKFDGSDCEMTVSKLRTYKYKDRNLDAVAKYMLRHLARFTEIKKDPRVLLPPKTAGEAKQQEKLKKEMGPFPPAVFPYIEMLAPLLLETLRGMYVPNDVAEDCVRIYKTIDKDRIWADINKVYERRAKIYEKLQKYITDISIAVLDWYFFFEPFSADVGVHIPQKIDTEVIAKDAPPDVATNAILNVSRTAAAGKIDLGKAKNTITAAVQTAKKHNPMVIEKLKTPVLLTRGPAVPGSSGLLIAAAAAAGVYLATRSS